MHLYRLQFSTNVERVALALAHTRLAVESIWIEPDDRSVVERVRGQGLVPVLEPGGCMAKAGVLRARRRCLEATRPPGETGAAQTLDRSAGEIGESPQLAGA